MKLFILLLLLFLFIIGECTKKRPQMDAQEIVKYIEGYTVDDEEDKSEKNAKNIEGNKLEICGTNPMTGWFRDGYCKTDEYDQGTHTVCSTMTNDFLNFTKRRGNDLTTPSDNNFPGLKQGDKWCLCARRWKEAYDKNLAPPVNINATNYQTEKHIDLNILKNHAKSMPFE